MLIIPAIDIKDGCVVRLEQGNLGKVKLYSRDPIEAAHQWITEGAELLHVVDLDAAATGTLRNLEILKKMLKDISVPLEFGGGVRSMETIAMLLDFGVYRVILGTKAAEDKNFLEEAFKKFDDKIIVSIDSRDKKVLIKGWQESSDTAGVLELAATLKNIGFNQMIYTDIAKDGMLKGPNIKYIKILLRKTAMHIIASGGVSSLADIKNLKLLEPEGVVGIIVGKALYEGKFTLAEALQLN